MRSPTRYQDLTGRVFGRLLVVGLARRDRPGRYIWQCLCDCDNEKLVAGNDLRYGNTKSCGCLRRESAALQGFSNVKHGMSFTSEVAAYRAALYRCTRPNNKYYRNYGGRGIRFLFINFKQFYDEIGPKPKGMFLDRIENNGHYEPGNVKWSTPADSAKNRRKAIYI